MKKWLIFILAILVLVGCSDDDNKNSTIEPPQNSDEVPQDNGTAEVTDKSIAEQAIDKLQQRDSLKFTLTEIAQYHPDLDQYERIYEMIYAPQQPFVYKKYEDNFFAGKYEAYVQSSTSLFIKNELGNNKWEELEGEYEPRDDLSKLIGELLTNIVLQAGEVEISEDMDGFVAFAEVATGDFKAIHDHYKSLIKALDDTAISPAVYEALTEFNDLDEEDVNISSIGLELFINEDNELTRYKIVFDFADEDGDFMMVEQIFNEVKAKDIKLPEVIAIR